MGGDVSPLFMQQPDKYKRPHHQMDGEGQASEELQVEVDNSASNGINNVQKM